MPHNWNLDDLYLGFNDKYKGDVAKLEGLIKEFISQTRNLESNPQINLERYLTTQEQISILIRSLMAYPSLVMATDVTNQEALKHISNLQRIVRQSTAEQVIFRRYLATLDLDKLAIDSTLINKYLFNLKEDQDDAKHLLSEKEEIIYSKMREYASSSWNQLHSLTTANLTVNYRDQKITLPEVRNLAYDSDKNVRKDAFEAELKSYTAIEDVVALSLSNIKREVLTMTELRGYSSPLEMTLNSSRMTQATLDAMLEAMKDFRPHFAAYLKAKAKYLGHTGGGLPFYDLFAPVGKLDKNYTYEESQKLVKEAFYGFSKRLGDFATKAFDKNWVDVEPKKGKRGGAFCSNQPQIKQSRILTNFTGSLNNVSTLAHELGHGYHGEVISNNPPLHWSYPMPLAETASIFCETILNNHILKTITDPQERLSVLENSLQGDTQVIIDILSRYFFESELFRVASAPISKQQMNNFMVTAQKEAYLDGLDQTTLHPYMWLNKPHYYSAGLNFYNFPYAFGLLFGKGLYAQYLKNPETFLANYDALLMLTTKANVEDCAKSMNIDVTRKEFWLDSLNEIKKDIDEVIKLMQA
jgi:pepF/M3 family oligoendopeptidase